MQNNRQNHSPNNHHRVAAVGLGLIALASVSINGVVPALANPPSASAEIGAKSNSHAVVTGISVSVMDTYTRILVSGDSALALDIKQAAGRGRRYSAAIVTIPGVWEPKKAIEQRVAKNGVDYVRYGTWSERQVRITAALKASLVVTSSSTADKKSWEIRIWNKGAKPVAFQAQPSAFHSGAPSVSPQTIAAEAKIVEAKSASRMAAPPKSLPVRVVAPAVAVPVAPIRVREPKPAPIRTFAALHAAPRPTASSNANGAGTVPVSPGGDKRVSLDFVGADINDVLKLLALQAEVNVVTGADVKGNITVSLSKVTVDEALDMVTRLSGFQYAKVGATYLVGSEKSLETLAGRTKAPEKIVEPVTELIPYRFVTPSALNKALETRFPGLKMSIDDKDNSPATPSQPKMVILTGTPERLAEAREFVAQIDRASTFPAGTVTDVYRVAYVSPSDLIGILSRLAPTVQVTLGPSQGFLSGSTGASASYASSGSSGGGGSAAASGGGAASGGTASPAAGGTANPAGAVASGSAPNALLLTGSRADVDNAKAVLAQIDVRVPQLSFAARVMDVGSTDISKIGLTYDFGNSVKIGEGVSGIGVGDANGKPGFGSLFRSPYSITAQLDLLAQNNKARLLANPTLAGLDGQPAVVFIGDQIKYVIRQEVTPTGTNIQTETATVGITLKVTGKSSPDGMITLYVHPEVSVISGYLSAGNGISLPQIATRFADTTIRVKDGETIGIGGLIRESDLTNIQKVPFLGDLPFFGQLFKRTEKNKVRSEIMIFITSRILKD